MNLGLEGRVALVTASTAGLGLAIARALSQEGAGVAISGRRADVATAEAARLPRTVGLEADLGEPGTAQRLVEAVRAQLGIIDVLVLNAGGPPPGLATSVGADDLRGAMESLVYPQIELVGLVLPDMRARKWGRILAVGSSGLQQPLPGLALSNSARPALAGYLKTLAAEVAQDGVTVNMILPGRISTDRVAQLDRKRAEDRGVPVDEVRAASEADIPVGRYGHPVEFAAPAVFLCSDRASYITGEQLRVDGGLIRAF